MWLEVKLGRRRLGSRFQFFKHLMPSFYEASPHLLLLFLSYMGHSVSLYRSKDLNTVLQPSVCTIGAAIFVSRSFPRRLDLAPSGLAPKLQATTTRGGLFRTKLPPLVPDPDFWCKAVISVTVLMVGVTTVPALAQVIGPILVNVNVGPTTIQVPVGVAANLCDINAAVLVQQFQDTGEANCTATNVSEATPGPGPGGKAK